MDKHSSSTATLPSGSQPFTLFIPSGTSNYSMRFSVKGHGQQRISLGTPSLVEATALAHRRYYEAVNRAESGLLVKNKSISALAADWLKLPRPPELPQKVAVRRITIDRYLAGYFQDKPVSHITEKALAAYQSWRNVYWITGPGKDITHLTYQRQRPAHTSLKSLPAPVRSPVTDAMRKAPASSTTAHENAILRDFFAWLKREGHLSEIPELPRIKNKNQSQNRPSFTDSELALFKTHLHKDIHDSKEQNRYSHFMFLSFVEIMLDSGLRDTECLRLKWQDIINFTTDTTYKDFNISLKIYGKSKSRIAIPNPSIIHTLQVLYSEYKNINGKYPAPDSYLFTYRNGNRVSSFGKQMANALAATGLSHDYRGVKRTCYSFRHFYITNALNHNVNIHLLARNTGTSTEMIEKHYSHVSLEGHRDKLVHASQRM